MKVLILALAGLLFFASTSQSRMVVHDDSGSEDPIYKRCRAKWGTNYKMQEFCIGQQFDANAKVIRWYKSSARDNEIYQQCGEQWTDGYGLDWRMLEFCIDKQESSRRRIYGR